MRFRLTGPGIVPLRGEWPSEAIQLRIARASERPRGDLSAGEGHKLTPVGSSLLPSVARARGHKSRANDPQTSRDAAALALPRAGTCKARLMDAIAQAPNGLTYDEAARLANVVAVTASTRLTELVRDGFLTKTGFQRPTGNGGEGDVFVAVRREAAA